jgi:hypothetical protein
MEADSGAPKESPRAIDSVQEKEHRKAIDWARPRGSHWARWWDYRWIPVSRREWAPEKDADSAERMEASTEGW